MVGGSPGDISPQMLWFLIAVGVSCIGAVAGGGQTGLCPPEDPFLPSRSQDRSVEILLLKLKGSILLPGKQNLMKGSEGSELSAWSSPVSEAWPPGLIRARGTQ